MTPVAAALSRDGPGTSVPIVAGTASGLTSAAPDLRTRDLDVGDGQGLAADRAILSEAERARADRFRFARDRDRYTRARAFLRRTLAAETGRPAAALEFVEGPWGKPALACCGPEFNLSHSGPLAVLAVSRDEPVGVDVELVDRSGDLDRLAESCFVPAERAVLAARDEADRRRRFFAFWTAKEALMKLTGQGMSLAPRAITLRLSDGWPVGCVQPGPLRGALLEFRDAGRHDAICCVARFAEGAAPFPPPT